MAYARIKKALKIALGITSLQLADRSTIVNNYDNISIGFLSQVPEHLWLTVPGVTEYNYPGPRSSQ